MTFTTLIDSYGKIVPRGCVTTYGAFGLEWRAGKVAVHTVHTN